MPNLSLAVQAIHPIPRWWQLPFALALAKDRLLPTQCYLCQVNRVKVAENIQTQGQIHWFNQLQFLCKNCHNSLAWQQSEFSLEITYNNQLEIIQGIASSFYKFPYQQVIRDFKNSHQLDKLPLLIHAIRQLERPLGCHAGNSVIIPMPTTTKRLTQRGFDPVTLLVKYLSFHWQIPVFTGVVRDEREKQQGLSREQRLSNVAGAFEFIELPNVPNIIVFDDVATTGATLQSLVDGLIQAQNDYHPNQPYTFFARAVAHG